MVGGGIVYQIAENGLYALKLLTGLYLLLWFLNLVSIVYSEWPNIRRILMWFCYFTVYMAIPALFLFLLSFNLLTVENTKTIEDMFDLWGDGLILSYLMWFGLCILIIAVSVENRLTKLKFCVRALWMPFYFLWILAIPRTVGFSMYILSSVTKFFRPTHLSK